MVRLVWNDVREEILMSCRTAREASQKLGLSLAAVKDHMRRLRVRGKTTKFFVREEVFWTPERDELLMACNSGKEAAALFGVAVNIASGRMSELRKKGKTTKYWGKPRSKDRLPTKNTVARWDIEVEREAKRGPYVPVKECDAFLKALTAHEKPPATVAVRDRQPLTRNPALYQGGLGASSINME